jgi:ABC-type antimicrobial peptide transport system permease subunit
VTVYSVTRRRYEFGVRLALGAEPAQIMGLAMREGAALAIVGLVLGVAAAAVAARFLQSQLFGVAPQDLASYAIAVTVIGIAAAVACWMPSWRASAISALEALRTE